MKIEIELPDWVEERHIRIFAGIEEVARKLHGQPLEIKVGRCVLCGKCCKGCQYLETREGYKQPNGEWAKMCSLNEARPQNCAHSDGFEEDCSITWQRVE